MDDLIARWILKANGTGSDDNFDAWETVNQTVMDDAEAGWQLVLRLVEAAPDDHVLGSVAAGPLEDLIHLWSGALIDRIEVQARRDPSFDAV